MLNDNGHSLEYRTLHKASVVVGIRDCAINFQSSKIEGGGWRLESSSAGRVEFHIFTTFW